MAQATVRTPEVAVSPWAQTTVQTPEVAPSSNDFDRVARQRESAAQAYTEGRIHEIEANTLNQIANAQNQIANAHAQARYELHRLDVSQRVEAALQHAEPPTRPASSGTVSYGFSLDSRDVSRDSRDLEL